MWHTGTWKRDHCESDSRPKKMEKKKSRWKRKVKLPRGQVPRAAKKRIADFLITLLTVRIADC